MVARKNTKQTVTSRGIPIPSALVEFILLGPLDDRRQIQDSPILGDVWVKFGSKPAARVELLISPYRGHHSGTVAGLIQGSVSRASNIAYLQGLIVADLTFRELVEVVVPKTNWWTRRWKRTEEKHDISNYDGKSLLKTIQNILDSADDWHRGVKPEKFREFRPFDHFTVLTGLILWAGTQPAGESKDVNAQVGDILKKVKSEDIVEQLLPLPAKMLKDGPQEPLVWQISLNRTATPALTKSIPAVKADAAKTLFTVNCSEIGWAVVDSGIDGRHPAFGGPNETRVKRTFDFTNYRKIVTLSNLRDDFRRDNLKELRAHSNWKRLINPLPSKEANDALLRLAKDAREGGPIHWDLVQKFVEIDPKTPPVANHGTHVAGIIGASKEQALKGTPDNDDAADGMCPDISLYDFRVIGEDIVSTEFAIVAALQFIRYLNARNNFITIHGANLSLSIPHDVRNFACGRTPICEECERVIDSGVVVVAAAGNHGYKSFQTKEGAYDSYAAFSITDPGNAEGVITVGATHRYWPHTYGVSFFSSRGPTGDGRLKPDLVAPGERIRAPLSVDDTGQTSDWGDLDGTSMAAPHVSGAAAMLMARYSELIGQPRRIKRLLCENATDLGRERSFQGSGMLDVLRAFQAI